jgi:hypothetical protein
MAPENAAGYDYARQEGYEFVARIDDDDLIVPGTFTLLKDLLDKDPALSGCGGEQVQFYSNPPQYLLPTDPSTAYNKFYVHFHGVTLFRTESLYPTVDWWRERNGYDIHRNLVRKMMSDGHVLGYVKEPISFWRRRDKNNNY